MWRYPSGAEIQAPVDSISNVHKLQVLGVMFQARMDHFDHYFDSLIAEFKSVIPRLNKCPLYSSLSRTGQASPNAAINRGILPTVFFLITTQEKTGLLILDLAPATKEMPCTVLVCKVTSHTGMCYGGKSTGNALTVSIKANFFQCLQEKPKSK